MRFLYIHIQKPISGSPSVHISFRKLLYISHFANFGTISFHKFLFHVKQSKAFMYIHIDSGTAKSSIYLYIQRNNNHWYHKKFLYSKQLRASAKEQTPASANSKWQFDSENSRWQFDSENSRCQFDSANSRCQFDVYQGTRAIIVL